MKKGLRPRRRDPVFHAVIHSPRAKGTSLCSPCLCGKSMHPPRGGSVLIPACAGMTRNACSRASYAPVDPRLRADDAGYLRTRSNAPANGANAAVRKCRWCQDLRSCCVQVFRRACASGCGWCPAMPAYPPRGPGGYWPVVSRMLLPHVIGGRGAAARGGAPGRKATAALRQVA